MKTVLALDLALFLAGCAVNKKANMFRGGLQRTGDYGASADHQFRWLRWKFKTDGWIRSSPVIVNDVIYFGSDGIYGSTGIGVVNSA